MLFIPSHTALFGPHGASGKGGNTQTRRGRAKTAKINAKRSNIFLGRARPHGTPRSRSFRLRFLPSCSAGFVIRTVSQTRMLTLGALGRHGSAQPIQLSSAALHLQTAIASAVCDSASSGRRGQSSIHRSVGWSRQCNPERAQPGEGRADLEHSWAREIAEAPAGAQPVEALPVDHFVKRPKQRV